MSTRPPQTQKQVFLQQLMLAAAVFLGFQMVCKKPAEVVDPRTSQDLIGKVSQPMADPPKKVGDQWDPAKVTLVWADSTLEDHAANEVNTRYQDKIDKELDAKEKGVKDPVQKKQLEEDAESQRLYGHVLLADTQLKSGIFHNDTNRIRQAYISLQGWERKYQGKPLWKQSFDVPLSQKPTEKYGWTKLSAEELQGKLVSELSDRNKEDLIYGVFPGYKIIDALVNLTGATPAFSYAFAAFLLALIVRAIIFPLAQRQLMWGRKMQQLAPLVKEIREQYTDKKTKQVTNQAELQQKTMALYGEYGINPLAGCLPALVQFPLFITVYQFMLHYQFAFRNGQFLWINPNTSAATHGFFAPNLGERDYMLIFFYGITMVVSTLLMPVSDPSQVKQQRIMGVGMGLLFTVMMFTGMFPTPAAFVLYWVFTNLLATAQSLRAYRMPLPPLEKVNTKAGGVFPMPPLDGGGGGGSARNGKGNGKPIGPITTPKSTGTPAKFKPKKRK